jgi:hypothetical protein
MRKSDAQAWKIGIAVAVVVAIISIGAMSVIRAPASPEEVRAEAKKERHKKKEAKLAKQRAEYLKKNPQRTYIAQITREMDCEWGEETSVADNKQLTKGQQVDLIKGLAQITFKSGAQVILEGPATFKVVSLTSGDLSAGKMTADVPDDVQNFTINTPMATIVDAEFDKKPQSEAEPEDPRRIRLGKGESVRLKAGESIRID